MDVFAQMAGAAMPGIDMARVIPTGPGLPPHAARTTAHLPARRTAVLVNTHRRSENARRQGAAAFLRPLRRDGRGQFVNLLPLACASAACA